MKTCSMSGLFVNTFLSCACSASAPSRKKSNASRVSSTFSINATVSRMFLASWFILDNFVALLRGAGVGWCGFVLVVLMSGSSLERSKGLCSVPEVGFSPKFWVDLVGGVGKNVGCSYINVRWIGLLEFLSSRLYSEKSASVSELSIVVGTVRVLGRMLELLNAVCS